MKNKGNKKNIKEPPISRKKELIITIIVIIIAIIIGIIGGKALYEAMYGPI